MSSCKKCKVELTTDNCYKKSSGYFRVYCKVCHNQKANAYNKISSKTEVRRNSSAKAQRIFRKNPANLSQIILKDSKGSDKKHNRQNDLTKESIAKIIANGCSYCGETQLRMTVDRVDNSIGHIESNVVSACVRCNLARGDMPYEAWLRLVPGMKEAREKGLFGDWTGRLKYKLNIKD